MENNNSQKNTELPNNQDAIDSVLERIKNNELRIKSKTYFRLKFAALIILSFALCIVVLFLSSFILFTLRASGHASLIGFGPNGWEVFLILFPWKLFFISLLLVFLLEWLLRSFRFGYKVPVLYLLTAVLVLTIATGYIIDHSGVHDGVFVLAGHDRLPPGFKVFYEEVRRQSPPPFGNGIFRGTITAIGSTSLQVNFDDPRKATQTPIRVILPPNQSTEIFVVGEKIFILGDIFESQIRAKDIKEAFRPVYTK